MKVYIRQVRKAEIDAVYDLEKVAFQPINYPYFVLRQFYDLMPELFLVAVDKSDDILGYTQGGVNVENGTGWILSLATKESCRGRGIGALLSQKVIDLLQLKGVKNIFLTVHPENTAATSLYNRLGFIIHSRVADYYGDGEPRLVMELPHSKISL